MDNFDALSGPDAVPPEIGSLSPTNNATGVYPGADLVATFSEDIALVTNGTVTIKNLTAPSQVVITLMDSQVTVSGDMLTIDPTNNLAFNTEYAIWISTNAVEDLADTPNTFGGITNDTTWSFTTVVENTSAPVITNTVPTNNATGVAPNANLVAEFDQNIVAGSGNITITNLTDSTHVTTIAITNVAQVSIVDNVLTIDTGVALAGANNFAVLIDAGAVENYSDVPFTGISGTTTWSFSVSSLTTYNQTGGDTDWNNAANWDNGVPISALDAVIVADKTAVANSASTPVYTGDLTLFSGALLDLYDGAGNLNALGGGTITMNAGSQLTLYHNSPDNIDIANDIAFGGNASIFNSGNGTDNEQRYLTGSLSGTGQFTYSMRRGNTLHIDGTNTLWSGGFVGNCVDIISSNLPNGVEPGVNDAFGSGNVTLNDAVRLVVPSGLGDTIGDTATLTLNGQARDGDKLVLGSDETIGALIVDGFQYPAATHGRVGNPSGVDFEWAWITGDGVLTVASDPADSSPPVLTITDFSANGIHYYGGAPLIYTLTFDEIVTSSVGTSDFDNAGTAPMSVQSVTQTDINVIEVLTSFSGPGTAILRAKASASFDDLFGNTLTGPVSDDTTITVKVRPTDPPIYEPFDMARGALAGQAGGTGLGTWTENGTPAGQVAGGSLVYGTLPASGNRYTGANGYCENWVPLSPPLSSALLDHGSELWFSVLIQPGTSANNYSFIGFSSVTGDIGANFTSVPTGANIVGIWLQNGSDLRFVYALDGTPSNQNAAHVKDNLSMLSPTFVVLKCTWGADAGANDLMEVYLPGTDLALPETPSYSSTIIIDQSSFAYLGVWMRSSLDQADEIRVAATYDEVIGIAPLPGGTMIILK